MNTPGKHASICIPAHNEERSIARTLDSVREAIPPLRDWRADIYVLANACSDGTVQATCEWAEANGLSCRHLNMDAEDASSTACGPGDAAPDVLVLETRVAGKPNAVNRLHALAAGDPLIFIDADVSIHPDAFRHLLAAMEEHPSARAACGIALAPSRFSFNPLFIRMSMKMKEFASKPVPYVNGPLYAIRKGLPEKIPEELIGEDVFLGMSLGVENLVKVSAAVAYQTPPSTYGDYFKRQVRNRLSDLQMKKLFGKRYADFRRDTRDPRSKSERLRCLSAWERILRVAFFPQTWAIKVLDKLAKKKAERMFAEGDVRWITIDSTKANPPRQ